jgi:hypothetical protein
MLARLHRGRRAGSITFDPPLADGAADEGQASASLSKFGVDCGAFDFKRHECSRGLAAAYGCL